MRLYKSLLFFTVLTIASAHADVPVLYLYGDVSDHGDVPSGDKEPFHPMRLNDTGRLGLSGFKEAVQEAGFRLDEKYDAAITLNDDLLSKYRVLILGSNQRMFNADEVKAVHQWIEQGGGLVAWSDSAFGGSYRYAGIGNKLGRDSNNLITERFGMYFLTDNGAGNYLISQYTEDHYLNNFNKDSGVRYRGEGVSCVRVSPPAKMLAPLQEGGLGGGMRVNKVDGAYQPDNDAALAIATHGKGRIVGTFDRNCFWNAGDGSRLSHVDNREFAQRLMVWAAGLEDEVKLKSKKRPKGTELNQPPVVNIKESLTIQGLQADLVATVTDDGQLNSFPEVRWKMVKGPGKVRFENDNPNTPSVRVFFPEPGSYRMQCTVTDGEFTISKRMKITVQP